MLIRPKEYLKNYCERPKKALGQHFLVQPKTAKAIVSALEIAEGDTVVEVGPGLGALTKYLIEYPCDLYLVEFDKKIADALKKHIPQDTEANIVLCVEDILNFNFQKLANLYGKRIKIIGNIPYSISSPLIFFIMENYFLVERAVFMVQKEVGDRWCAEHNSRIYGVPSVMLACCANREKLFHVGKGQFYPSPKVDSSVIRLSFFKKALWSGVGYTFFREFISALFKGRRKTVLNTLKKYLKAKMKANQAADFSETLLKKACIQPTKRPEQISPLEFVRLTEEVSKIFKHIN